MERDNKKTFYNDYQKLKDSIDNIGKNAKGFNYSYADLLAVKGETDEAIKTAGFVLMQIVKEGVGTYSREHTFYNKADKQEKIVMTTQAYNLNSKLIHIATGEVLECDIPLYSDDIDPQVIGSAITYMRRYSLYVILDLKTEDDDGAGASNKAKTGSFNNDKEELPKTFEEAKKFLNESNKKTAYYGDVKEWDNGLEKQELTRIIYPK